MAKTLHLTFADRMGEAFEREAPRHPVFQITTVEERLRHRHKLPQKPI